MDRTVRFSCVESTWDWLSRTIPVDSKLVASLPVASCNLRDVLKLQLRALAAQSEWKTPDVYRPGELWIILGIDGVPLWKSHVVAGTLALTGTMKSFEAHSPARHFLAFLFRGYDSVVNVKAVFDALDLDNALNDINGTQVQIHGLGHYQTRVFPCGDHMISYKINGRDGPRSTRPERTPCTCCDAPAPEVLTYTAPERPYAKSPSAMFQCIPAEQHGIDCAHGMTNMLFGVLMPTCEAHAVTTKKVAVNVWEATLKELTVEEPPADNEATTEEVDATARSITNARHFFQAKAYHKICDLLRVALQGEMKQHNGNDVPLHRLLHAMFVHTGTMVNVAYTPKPTASDIQCATRAAQALRKVLATLEAPATPWGHIWTVHVPQFLLRWGTLFPFLCHGLEGRWSPLKTEIKLCTKGMWRGAKVGFATVVVYNIVTWAFMCLNMSLIGRENHVSRMLTKHFDEFDATMRARPPL